MSRCKACDKKLNDIEVTRKRLVNGTVVYEELCTKCLYGTQEDDTLEVELPYDVEYTEDY